MESRFITAAFSGTRTERNINPSSSTETPTTNAITSHSRCSSIAEMSEKNGVHPVTSALGGSCGPQVVDEDGGALVGGPEGGLRGDDRQRPVGCGDDRLVRAIRSSAPSVGQHGVRASAEVAGTTTVSGPFAPAPNSAATRS